MKNSYIRTHDPPSQSSLKEYNSDFDDADQDSDSGGGFDTRMNMDNSDPIEAISDDDFYNDDRQTTYNDMAVIHSPDAMYFDDIETFTDDENVDNANGLDRPIPQRNFKPFKALEGLDQWRPDSAELWEAATRNANTNNDTDTDNDSIEEIHSDMDLDTAKASSLPMNDNSLDSIRSISPSLSPPPAPRRDSIYGSMKNSNPPRTAPAPAPLRSLSHPTPAPYQTKTQDTRKNSHSVKPPAFILDHIHNNTTNKSHLPIKKDGLASFALDCINQELTKFRAWQSSVLAEMAKHGSLSKVCMQDHDGRLCRILEMWVEHDMVFSWCVDLTIKEREQLLETTAPTTRISSQQHDLNDDDMVMMQHDSDTGISSSSQPLPSLPTYEPNDDDRPYVCVFATTYLNGPRKNIISKLMMAEYIAIWAPWTTVPIHVDGVDMHVHIVTRFMMDDLRV